MHYHIIDNKTVQCRDNDSTGIKLEQKHVLSQSSDAPSKADDEDDAPDDHEKEANVEHHIKDGLQLESLSTAPLVKGSIDSNPDQKETREPKQEIEEKHCILDTG